LNPRGYPENTVAIAGVQIGRQCEVPYMDLRRAPQCDIAENPAQPPHVLVFHIAASRIPVHFDRKHILLSGNDIRGEVELCRIAAVHAVSDLLSVHPHKKTGVDTVEGYKDAPPTPVRRNIELAAVATDRITFEVRGIFPGWLTGHPWPVLFERVGEIGVDRRAVTLHLHVGGHRDLLPPAHIEAWLVEINRALLRPGNPMELPLAVQAASPGRRLAVRCQSLGAILVRH